MYMAALQREPSAAARSDLMLRMNQSLQALGGMFDVLLDVSRLDAGLVPVNAAPLRLDTLLERLVDEHRLPAHERGLALRLRLPRESAAAGESDAVLLEGCLRNLLDNALKYTPRGGVVVRLRALTASNQWRIEVRDTGPGIAPAMLALVFHEFFQIGNEERDRSKGLGLGLSIVKRTAALLGHPLGLESRPARGSCFHLAVPRGRKAGEIIPEIVRVLTDLRPSGAQVFKMPEKCPVCGSVVVKSASEAVLRCVNPYCGAILKGSLVHWVSRDAMDINGLGEKLVEQLVDAKFVTSVADLYDLTVAKLMTLERMGIDASPITLTGGAHIAEMAKDSGFEYLLLPIQNANEASVVV